VEEGWLPAFGNTETGKTYKIKREETNRKYRILRHMELHDFSFSPGIIRSREMGLAAHVVSIVQEGNA
jgi:hypothetical protein